MKKLKILTIGILIIVIISGIIYKAFGATANTETAFYGNDGRTSLDVFKEEEVNSKSTTISFLGLHDTYNNIYCIERGQKMDGEGRRYWPTTKVEINGNTATIYTALRAKTNNEYWESDGVRKYGLVRYEKQVEVTNEMNNVLAAILTPGTVDGKKGQIFETNGTYTYGYAMGTSKTDKRYTDAQIALYYYINDWIEAVGANQYGFEVYNANESNESGTPAVDAPSNGGVIANTLIEQAKTKSQEYSYKVTIYLLKPAAANDAGYVDGYSSSTWQTLMATYPSTPTKKPQDKNITVKKVWADSNQYGNQPSSITVKLLKSDGTDTGKSVVLNANNSWTGKFTGLSKSESYKIKEVSVTGYTSKITGNETNGFTITNTLQKTSVSAKKNWADDNNRDGVRPSSVTVTLYENGAATSTTKTLNASNGWACTFSGLLKYKNGKQVEYSVVETDANVPSGYTRSSKYDATSGYIITNTHTPEKTTVKVSKSWSDDSNRDGIRPNSVTVKLLADGADTGLTATLSQSNNWTHTFSSTSSYTMYKYKNGGTQINYTVEESTVPTGYTKNITGKMASGFTVTNTHTPEKTTVKVTKKWDDDSNRDGIKPDSVTVKLLADGADTGLTATLSQSNNWTHTFSSTSSYTMYKYKNGGTQINYTVEETTVPTGYTKKITGNMASGFTITNTHVPAKVKVSVLKEWDDMDNLDDLRPQTIKVTLYANGISKKTVTLSESEGWTYTFENLYKYENGEVIDYTIQESAVDGYTSQASKTQDADGNVTYTIKNSHTPNYEGYIEITGKVWKDRKDGKANEINGILDDDETGLGGIKVRLYDKNGKQTIKATYSDEDGKFSRTDYAITKSDGTYTIRVNYDNSKNVYKLYEDADEVKSELKTAYVEFEYDGIKYTTVATAETGANTSKAKEDEAKRITNNDSLDKTYSKVTPNTSNPLSQNITAATKDVISFETYADTDTATKTEVIKYCNGNGKYEHTNPDNAWEDIITGSHSCENCTGSGHTMRTFDVEVGIIQNVNLGLFEREQPDVAIFTDLTKVEVTMNNQKYTYLYGVRGNALESDLKVKFQNKNTYTYRRAVNPADIAYIQEAANSNAMSVLVTYEVKVANFSTTLPVTVHNIINAYDSEYEINSITKGSENISFTNSETDKANKLCYSDSDIYKSTEFKEITLYNLDIILQPEKEAEGDDVITITYKVSMDAIKGLLNEKATLNNGVEIHTYSAEYGKDTVYAEQREGGRTDQPYAGYDYNSHPGNARMKLTTDSDGIERIKSTDANGNIIDPPEDDTDFAPSFILEKGTDKVLSGTVWEDTDNVTSNEERVGDGKYDDTSEENVQNVKVELYNIDGTRATLYDSSGNPSDAVVYTDGNGTYAFNGVVTSEYFVKFTYGNDTTKEIEYVSSTGATEKEKELKDASTMDGGATTINARNDKSTIITDSIIKNIISKEYSSFSEEDKKWHITHGDNYSIAVDNMKDRLDIEDLKYENYTQQVNMAAYSKPFKLQVEYEATGESQITATEEELNSGDIKGNIEGVSNQLDKLDFGIIERARENLSIEKTVTYLKITLANGQVLTEGDPRTSINWVKSMQQAGSTKRVLAELDAELIQGAQLEVKYEIVVNNNNEIDYDYGTSDDYSDIYYDKDKPVAQGKYDEYITKSNMANYYFFGNASGLSEIQATVEFVDYLTDKIIFNENKSAIEDDTSIIWNKLDSKSDLLNKGLISNDVEKSIEEGEYTAFQMKNTNTDSSKITIQRGGTSDTYVMYARKMLANDDENVYDNNVEIITIDAKSARTIKESSSGEQVEKEYVPGNYVPSGNSESEQDDDRAETIITPPTGVENNIMIYIIPGLIGLIVIAIGVFFIKKKIIN